MSLSEILWHLDSSGRRVTMQGGVVVTADEMLTQVYELWEGSEK